MGLLWACTYVPTLRIEHTASIFMAETNRHLYTAASRLNVANDGLTSDITAACGWTFWTRVKRSSFLNTISKVLGFKYPPGHRISWLPVFVVFLSPYRNAELTENLDEFKRTASDVTLKPEQTDPTSCTLSQILFRVSNMGEKDDLDT
jgi:hypothetical protein